MCLWEGPHEYERNDCERILKRRKSKKKKEKEKEKEEKEKNKNKKRVAQEL